MSIESILSIDSMCFAPGLHQQGEATHSSIKNSIGSGYLEYLITEKFLLIITHSNLLTSLWRVHPVFLVGQSD